MRVTSRDPMSGRDVADTSDAPFVLEGQGDNALKIYFETEQNREQYLAIKPRIPEACSLNLYRTFQDNAYGAKTEPLFSGRFTIVEIEYTAKPFVAMNRLID